LRDHGSGPSHNRTAEKGDEIAPLHYHPLTTRTG
jgi:hypothetical protein